MSRDYKPTSPRSNDKSKSKPFITGLLLGLLLGVGLSAGLAIFIQNGDSPFNASEPRKEKPEPVDEAATSALPQEEQSGKPRFDFYTILPGSESQVTEQEIQQQEETERPVAAANEKYFLQVGAFQTEKEADNMKAQLALLGMESIVQTATIPDKGTWHRVRVGPLTGLGQINKARSDLVRNGFKSDLIKVDANASNQ